jgi:hypothetical protein
MRNIMAPANAEIGSNSSLFTIPRTSVEALALNPVSYDTTFNMYESKF